MLANPHLRPRQNPPKIAQSTAMPPSRVIETTVLPRDRPSCRCCKSSKSPCHHAIGYRITSVSPRHPPFPQRRVLVSHMPLISFVCCCWLVHNLRRVVWRAQFCTLQNFNGSSTPKSKWATI
ncbi:hypothetical protein PanWU01x14_298640 [Parasponia andersonii]|uniref:Uncharacterized protein n=1 Tax=Parasponia andersonii TaxID=3476 RepID=A0A2P5AUU3_PARAD|nr:hypothetical protein PanWU01x14_298640 [Parasponia andersonii]